MYIDDDVDDDVILIPPDDVMLRPPVELTLTPPDLNTKRGYNKPF